MNDRNSTGERRFARDPAAVGKTLYLNKIPFSVIGILPPTFFGRNVAGKSADIVLPMFMQSQLALRDHNTFEMMARLKPGVSAEQARIDLDVIYQQVLTGAAGTEMSAQVEQGIRAQRIVLTPGLRGTTNPNGDFAKELRILLAVVGLVLLIACANVANLLLAHSATRRKEIAVHLSLGASRGRLIRQLLTESILLAMLAGGLGLLLAQWGVEGLARVLSYGQTPLLFDLKPDLRILAFTGAVSLLTGVLFAKAGMGRGGIPSVHAGAPRMAGADQIACPHSGQSARADPDPPSRGLRGRKGPAFSRPPDSDRRDERAPRD